jgi:fucose permease
MSSALLAENLSWKVSYMILAGLSGVNLLGMLVIFWNTPIEVHDDPATESLATDGHCKKPKESLFKQTLKQRITQVGAFFLLFYVGIEVTFGSWSYTFLTEVRGGDPVQLGQITSGYWAGLTFGRLVLGAITARFGEKRMVTLYLIITFAMVCCLEIADCICQQLTNLICQ